jgi:hypothetical protein
MEDALDKTMVALKHGGETHLASLRKLPKDLYLRGRDNKSGTSCKMVAPISGASCHRANQQAIVKRGPSTMSRSAFLGVFAETFSVQLTVADEQMGGGGVSKRRFCGGRRHSHSKDYIGKKNFCWPPQGLL